MTQRSDSPWYPSMRLFRQTQRGDWAGVFARMAETLSEVVSKPRDNRSLSAADFV